METLFFLQAFLILMITLVLFVVTEFVFPFSSRLEVDLARGSLFSLSSSCFAPSGLALVLVVGLSFHEGRFDFGEKHRRRVILGLCCFSLPLLFALFLLVMAGGRGPKIVFIIFEYAPAMMVFFELAKLLLIFHLLKPRQRQALLGLGFIFLIILGILYDGFTKLESKESGDPVTTLEIRLAYLSMLASYWICLYELAFLKFVHDLRKRMKAGELRPAPDFFTGPGAKYYQVFISQPAPPWTQTLIPTGNESGPSDDTMAKDENLESTLDFREGEENEPRTPEPGEQHRKQQP